MAPTTRSGAEGQLPFSLADREAAINGMMHHRLAHGLGCRAQQSRKDAHRILGRGVVGLGANDLRAGGKQFHLTHRLRRYA
ncbi:MAG: hypothetical protein ACK55I_33250, partial [bacterium]